jgi:hypothetical protein
MTMTSGQRTTMWVVFAVLLIVAAAFSARDPGIREGAQGSYLGRAVNTAQPVSPNVRDTLENRANSGQRY